MLGIFVGLLGFGGESAAIMVDPLTLYDRSAATIIDRAGATILTRT